MSFLDIFRRKPPPTPESLFGIHTVPDPGVFGWSFEDVQLALEAAESGDLTVSGHLAQAMERDPIIRHGLQTRIRSMVRCPLVLQRPEGLDETKFAVLKDWFHREGFTADDLASVSKHRVISGVGPAQVTWHSSGGQWLFKVRPINAGHIAYQSSEGKYVVVADDGVHDFVPDGERWVLFKDLGSIEPWLEAALRPLGAFWWWTAAVWRFRFAHAKTHGTAIKKTKVPGEQREGEDVRAYTQRARDLMGGAVVTCPQFPNGVNFDFELIEAKALTWEAFGQFIDKADDYKTLILLGAVDNTRGAGAGSRARAEVHQEQSNSYLDADAVVTAEPINKILRAWARFNGIDQRLAPTVLLDTSGPADAGAIAQAKKTNAEALEKMVAACQALEEMGVAVDWTRLAVSFDVPIRDGEPRGLASGLLQMRGLAAQARGSSVQACGAAIKSMVEAQMGKSEIVKILAQAGFEL